MVKVGVFDADAMCGELLAALAASHASATTDRRRLGDECRVARALVRGIAGVVAVSIVDPARRSGTDSDSIRGKPPARGRLAEWVGPKHPLARALRAHPTGAPPAILAAVARESPATVPIPRRRSRESRRAPPSAPSVPSFDTRSSPKWTRRG